MRQDNRNGEGECYQVNAGIKAVYDEDMRSLVSLTIAEKPVVEDQLYSICVQGFHFTNAERYLGLQPQEFLESGKIRVVCTSAQQVSGGIPPQSSEY